MYSVIDDSYFIPCLLIRGMSKKVMIHFHANGEDISHTQRLLTRFSIEFKLNIICVEYPGYGVYNHYSENKGAVSEKKSEQIIMDAKIVYNFVINVLKCDKNDVIISGRSIGSGPACHLAATVNPLCLILISPIKSVTHIAR